VNEDYHTRGARLEEQLAVLRARWTQEVVTFHGRWHHLDEMGIHPRPRGRPIPIWLGGHIDASFRRVATVGDGWMSALEPDDEARQFAARIHEFVQAVGRDPHSVGSEAVVILSGKTPDGWRREVERWRAGGRWAQPTSSRAWAMPALAHQGRLHRRRRAQGPH
jgi:alkanesulfonate monooxygenase SsuD/methylene tetrahydromethanopterin reductase-like flavin-dependent oxidoreductase (luciferase family)